MHISHLVKQHVQVAVTDAARFYDHSVAQPKQDEQVTLPSPLTGMSPNFSHTSSEKNKKEQKKNNSPSPSKLSESSKSRCRKFGSSKDHFDDYQFDRINDSPKGVKEPIWWKNILLELLITIIIVWWSNPRYIIATVEENCKMNQVYGFADKIGCV